MSKKKEYGTSRRNFIHIRIGRIYFDFGEILTSYFTIDELITGLRGMFIKKEKLGKKRGGESNES